MSEDKVRSIDGATIELMDKAREREYKHSLFQGRRDEAVSRSGSRRAAARSARWVRAGCRDQRRARKKPGWVYAARPSRQWWPGISPERSPQGLPSHSDHAREVVETFLKTARGETQGFAIKDEIKLLEVALDFGIDIEGRELKEIAVEIGEKALAEFGKQHGELNYIRRRR